MTTSSPEKIQTLEEKLNSKNFDLNEISVEEVLLNNFFLSTSDNPFKPFENFNNWFAFDRKNNYNSLELIAKFAFASENLGNFQEKLAILQAMRTIIRYNVSGKHVILVQRAPDSDDSA